MPIKNSPAGFTHILLLLAGVGLLAFFALVSFAPFKGNLFSTLFLKSNSFAATDPITNITTNASTYPNSQIPKYEKFEITFDVTTAAKNMFYPFDPSPPPGVTANEGVTVNAEVSQDNFVTKSTIPAFYYQDFDYQVKSGKDWLYPKNQFFWKVRFAPPTIGTWQYRLTKIDSSGTFTSPVGTFTVADSANKGFIKVSQKDSRYFEYEDGTYFPGLGYNMNFDHIRWDNPVQANTTNFQIMGQNGPLLIRNWLSQWGIWPSGGNPWRSQPIGSDYDSMTDRPADVPPGKTSAMEIKWPIDQTVWSGSPCMSTGWLHESPAVKPNTNYKITLTYRIPEELAGPNVSGQPYGFVAKLGNWLTGTSIKLPTGTTWRTNQECAFPAALVNQLNPGASEKVLTPYVKDSTTGFTSVSANFTTAVSGNYLPMLYLVTENVTGSISGGTATVIVDNVAIQEDLGGGQLGPNILSKGSMDQLTYTDQKYSYAFDKVLELAHQNNIYLKEVALEKNDQLMDTIDFNGVGGVASSNNNFYGNGRNMTKIRWLQQAWWRYMQARWGYSTNIHSWELLNEGDPFHGGHYILADEFGKYMHQFKPNDHLVTTSTWHSYPQGTNQLWDKNAFPNLDYGDFHAYFQETKSYFVRTDKTKLGESVAVFQPSDFYDTAEAAIRTSLALGAKTASGINKPTMHGEAGFFDGASTNNPSPQMTSDTTGKWLHKYTWASLNPGGVMNSYWYDTQQIYPTGSDKRPIFGKVNTFLKDIPLSNGNYKDASASATNASLRTIGQKDTVNKRAHLWIDNKTDTWKNLISSVAPTNVTAATVTIPNMPQGSYPVSWIDTYTGNVIKTETISVGSNGNLDLSVTNLTSDVAVKIGDYSQTVSTPPPSTQPSSAPTKPGDIVVNNKVDIFDYNALLTDFGKKNDPVTPADLDNDNDVDIFDYNILLTNFGL